MDIELTQKERYQVQAVLAAAKDALAAERPDSGVAEQLRSGINLVSAAFNMEEHA